MSWPTRTQERRCRACTGPWLSLNPRPDHERWAEIAPFAARIAAAIDEVSAYWAGTAGDLTPVFADVGKVAAREEARAYREELREAWVASAVAGPRLANPVIETWPVTRLVSA